MNKKTIFVDVDGVLAHTMEKVLKRYNNLKGVSLTLENLKEYDLHKNENVGSDIYDIFKEKSFFRDLRVREGSKEVVSKLVEENYEIIFSTAILKEGYNDRHEWLKEHFPFVPEENYMFGRRKDLLHGDIIIDDCPSNLLNSNCKHLICMNQPWNQSLKNTKRKIERVFSFKQFYDIVNNPLLNAKAF